MINIYTNIKKLKRNLHAPTFIFRIYASLWIFHASRGFQQREQRHRRRLCPNYKEQEITKSYVVASLQRQREKFLKIARRCYAYNVSLRLTMVGGLAEKEKKNSEKRPTKRKRDTDRQRTLCINDNAGCQ